jgi:hypothetical protein
MPGNSAYQYITIAVNTSNQNIQRSALFVEKLRNVLLAESLPCIFSTLHNIHTELHETAL